MNFALQPPELTNLASWFGVPIPSYVATNVRFFAYVNKAHNVPFRVDSKADEDQRLLYAKLKSPSLDKTCLDLLYLFTGTAAQAQDAHHHVIEHLAQIMVRLPDTMHYRDRQLTEGPERDFAPRLFLMRVYHNADFECPEHPEMLLGVASDSYKCWTCQEVQVPGTAHHSTKSKMGN